MIAAEEPVVVARGLTRRFGSVLAVDHVDLTVPPKRLFGFLGPNGSGKSTTIRMLCGLLKPSEGEARVLGFAVPRDAEKLRSAIGYMTQKFSLYDDLLVRQNLEFLGRIHTIPSGELSRRVGEMLEKFDLERLADHTTGTLSGGEKQRLALAGAMLHRPKLLFLDEPTSAVDPQSRRDFWEKLFLLLDEGASILVSTHYMDEAERCHQLAILDEGRIVAEGEPDVLIERIAGTVVSVETTDFRSAKVALQADRWVKSVAQLGGRMHVLMRSGAKDPVALVESVLRARGIAAVAQLVRPNLEDVFVAVTRERRAPSESLAS